jgi:hypothetical protein
MASESTIQILNQLLAIHARSLPVYLSYAQPEWHRGDGAARETLQSIVDDQLAMVDRLGELIIEHNGTVTGSAFPMEFTGYHDLSFDFLCRKLVEYQRRDIQMIERCVRLLSSSLYARAVAEEALGAAKAHLEALLRLKPSAAAVA